ncbi:MAG: hypothetical protein Q8K72_12975 [Acidimicrobiales bacterium]|nr:hypothetical protein [Acidimicrobiales bacterium]
MDEVLLEVDDRRRVTLGKLGKPEHRRYLAAEEPDGTIVLSPAVVMSELEARFLANTALVEQIEENRRHPERLVQRRGTGAGGASS